MVVNMVDVIKLMMMMMIVVVINLNLHYQPVQSRTIPDQDRQEFWVGNGANCRKK